MTVKYFDWDDTKGAKLTKERGLGFEDIVFHIERGDLLDVLEHPSPGAVRRPARLRRAARGLSSKDLEAIQKRALAEGLPDQTLISSLLYKHASGRLKEV